MSKKSPRPPVEKGVEFYPLDEDDRIGLPLKVITVESIDDDTGECEITATDGNEYLIYWSDQEERWIGEPLENVMGLDDEEEELDYEDEDPFLDFYDD